MNKNILLIAFFVFIIAFSGLAEAQYQSNVYSLLRRKAQAQAKVQPQPRATIRAALPTRPSRTNASVRKSKAERNRVARPEKATRPARVNPRPSKSRKNN